LQHSLAAIAETRRFNCQQVERAAQLVEHERRQRFTVHIFGHHDQDRACPSGAASSISGTMSAAALIFLS
jgi:hypothetical protein